MNIIAYVFLMSNVYVNNFNIWIFDFCLCFKSNNPINSSNFEYKEVYAYSIQTSCDKNGWILGYKTYPGNLHDSTTFPSLALDIPIW